VLGAVARRHGDFSAAEDAVQEALLAAATQWPTGGVPHNPRGWLYHVALRRLTDHIRSEVTRRRREDAVAADAWAQWAFVPAPDVEPGLEQDDTLAVLFMCCHPVLTMPSVIALTLRAVGGLTTAEIARSFLVPEATMAQRISRAKQSIRASGMPFRMPDASDRGTRLATVLRVLYLMFTEGHTRSHGGDLHRVDLADEAIRLARMLHGLLPDEPEAAGLLALLLLTHARRAARTGPAGELIALDEQDRTRWDRDMIAEGVALLSGALPRGAVGAYQLQAAIAALHDEAAGVGDTDWPQILALYDMLARISDNPVVRLNRAVAVSMVHGPEAGLSLLNAIGEDARLEEHHRLAAVRAHLLERAGRREPAIAAFREAADRTLNVPERDYLLLRAARLAAERRPPTG
jgi:predicted RNA polymerase sigma factor